LGGGVPAIRALREFLPHTGFRDRWTRVGREAILRLIECLEPPADETPTDRPCWITEVHELLGREDEQRRSMASISAMFRCHPGSLARAFRRHYGTSISAFRRRTRVDRAIDRLIDGDGSLIDLAHGLGYADQSHLTREFKHETGWAPGHLRSAVTDWGRLPRAGTHPG
jgi:AraC-like DNA-binding protein